MGNWSLERVGSEMPETGRVSLGDFSNRQVLITGGLGFIGSNLARTLVEKGARVSLVDKADPNTGAEEFNLAGIENKVDITLADVRDIRAMRGLVRDKEYLFNLGGLSSHLGGLQDPAEDLEVNALAQLGLLKVCREVQPSIRIVFAGTRQVYGAGRTLPVAENAAVFPVDFNGVSKLAGELYHILSHRIYGIWTTSLRMTNTYGPRMRVKDARQTFVGEWIRLLLQGKKFVIYGSGRQVRDFNYVDDVVEALLRSVTKPRARGRIYNLGADPVSLVELADLLISLNGGGGYEFKPFPEDRLRIDVGDYAGDYSKIQGDLGWRPGTDLKEGLSRTLDYYRINNRHYW